MLDAYIEVPYDAISAFPVDMTELSNINTSSLIEEKHHIQAGTISKGNRVARIATEI